METEDWIIRTAILLFILGCGSLWWETLFQAMFMLVVSFALFIVWVVIIIVKGRKSTNNDKSLL